MDRLKLPGRNLWYTAPAIAGVAYLAGANPLFGLAFLAWGILEWGRWFDLGRLPDGWAREGIEMTVFEKAVTKVSFGSDHVAMLWRHLVGVPGLYLLVGPMALVFPFAVVAVYELNHQLLDRKVYDDNSGIHLAELLTGVIWAAYILLGAAQ